MLFYDLMFFVVCVFRTIDKLENDEHFFTQVKRIKAFHAELAKIRNKRDVLEKDMRNIIFSKPPSTKDLLQYQMDIEVCIL